MIARQKQTVLLGALAVLLVAAALWNVRWMLDQRGEARYEAEELAACRKLAGRIKKLRQEQQADSDSAEAVKKPGEHIHTALRRVGVGAESGRGTLEGIYRQPARPLQDAPYVRKPTSLTLRDVSLLQLGNFLYYVTEDSGLSASDLRLRSPHGEVSGDVWNAEITLSYLIYSPSEEEATR